VETGSPASGKLIQDIVRPVGDQEVTDNVSGVKLRGPEKPVIHFADPILGHLPTERRERP